MGTDGLPERVRDPAPSPVNLAVGGGVHGGLSEATWRDRHEVGAVVAGLGVRPLVISFT